MDQIQSVIDSIVKMLHSIGKLSTGLVVALAIVALIIGAISFLRKDNRGDEEGKNAIMRAGKAVVVAVAAYTILTALSSWVQSVLGQQ
jgi:hypothetical protein